MTLIPQWLIGMRDGEMSIAIAKPDGNALTDAPDDLDLYISSNLAQIVMRGVVSGASLPSTVVHGFGSNLSVYPNQIGAYRGTWTSYDRGYVRPFTYGGVPISWATVKCSNGSFIVDESTFSNNTNYPVAHTGPDVNYFAFNRASTVTL